MLIHLGVVIGLPESNVAPRNEEPNCIFVFDVSPGLPKILPIEKSIIL